jgi:tetratricopeptide (TPR) repeat protein
MKAFRFMFQSGLLMGLAAIPTLSTLAQTASPKESEPRAPALRKLTGNDAKRAEELDKAVEAALNADRWDEAIARAEELLALRTRAQGPKHFETVNAEWRLKTLRRVTALPKQDRAAYRSASAMTAQAEALFAQGKYAQSQPLLEKALSIRRRLLTDDHPDTAASYSKLARNLAALGKYTQAQPLFERALAIHRRLLTDDHPATATSYNNVAFNLNNQGKYVQSQGLYEKALEISRRLLTDDNPRTATCYNNLAMNLNAQGKYAEAQPLFEKSLAIKRRLLTDDNPDTAISYNNLALNLEGQGKYTQAQPLFEKALAIRRRLLTDDHPHTAASYNSVAANFNSQGKYAEAQPLFEKALEIRRRLLTDDHPDTASSYNSVAFNLNSQGKYAQAQPLFEKALAIRRRQLTDDHPDTASSYNNVAFNLNSQGKSAQAQPLYEKALAIRRRLLTDENRHTSTSYNNLALNLDAQGKYIEAQPLHEKALAIRRRLLTDDHPDTAAGYNNLAGNLRSQGKYTAAQPLFEKALAITRRLLSDEHPQTALSYNNLALNLKAQGKYAEAQPLYEKALAIHRRLLTDEHPRTAGSYNNLASNLNAQGKYAQAQPLFEKALAIKRRLLTDEHPQTCQTYRNLAYTLSAQGRYADALKQWVSAVKSQDASRLRVAFTGLERAETRLAIRPALAAVLARLGKRSEAWQALEEDLGRGLLDELAARQDRRLAPAERDRVRELTSELERLDKLVEANPKELDQAGRAKRFEELKRERERASIALGDFQTKLVKDHGALAGQVATLNEIQAALPADTALVTWIDIPPPGPNAADADGEHWGVVARSRGVPIWVPISGTGKYGLWTNDDTVLANRARTELRRRPGPDTADLRSLLERLRSQRVVPLAKALGNAADGLPAVQRLIVLPSRAMAGIPVEALLTADDDRIVSYTPSATVFKYLREQPRPERHAGLLALGDPVYERPEASGEPAPLPDRGLLVSLVAPGSNAATHGLKAGDVLMAYNGVELNQKNDFKVVAEGDKPIVVEVWKDGRLSPRNLAPGKLGVVLDPRPAAIAIAENRALEKVLVAARGASDEFPSLPGTRYEVEALGELFKADDRPTRILLGADASEQNLEQIAASGELGRFGFIHLATHGVIDEATAARSAVILTQKGLPDPLEQALNHKPVFDGRLSVREIQRGWELKAELVTLSACETALGREAGGEGFVGFTQALLMSGARSVCLSLWKVDDTATALMMQRFYANLLGRRAGLMAPLPKADALREAKVWLRGLRRAELLKVAADLSGGVARSKGTKARQPAEVAAEIPAGGDDDRPYASPHFWAAFVLAGDPD